MANANVAERVTYGLHRDLDEIYFGLQARLLDDNPIVRVVDIGGGANPAVSEEEVARRGLEYTLCDIDPAELEKAPPSFRKLALDFTAGIDEGYEYDLAISKFVMEHVTDAEAFHRNIYRNLAPGGLALHIYPCLYALPFTLNWVIPERLSSAVLDAFAPRDRHQHDKFPAYYDWCTGPTDKALARYESLGFEVEQCIGLFGHHYYNRIPGLRNAEQLKSDLLLKNPVPWLAAFAIVVLRKPA